MHSMQLLHLIRDREIPCAKRTLYMLASHRNEQTGLSFPSTATLAGETGLSERTVRRDLDALVDCGLISPVRYDDGGHGRATEYRVEVETIAAMPVGAWVRSGRRGRKGDMVSGYGGTVTATAATTNGDIGADKGDTVSDKAVGMSTQPKGTERTGVSMCSAIHGVGGGPDDVRPLDVSGANPPPVNCVRRTHLPVGLGCTRHVSGLKVQESTEEGAAMSGGARASPRARSRRMNRPSY